jgi:GNAT superfamily N-acetyltransferase
VDISRLTIDDSAAVEETWNLLQLNHRTDRPDTPPPSRVVFEAEIAGDHPEEREERYAARVDGRVVGAGGLGASRHDNHHLAFTYIQVHPEYRRRGIGSALLDHVTDRARAEGRTTQTSHTSETLPGGPFRPVDGREFARAKGFDIVHTERSRKLSLVSIEGKIETELLDDARPHATDYEVLQWIGPTPEEFIEGVAALESRLVSDVPLGGLDVEEQEITPERTRAKDAYEAKIGRVFASTYVRHRPTGDLVGHAVVAVFPDTPEYGYQWITLVHPDHRGHRLGTIVKIENHRLLRRELPSVRWIITANAEVNTHMVAINERMGFVEMDRQLELQRKI